MKRSLNTILIAVAAGALMVAAGCEPLDGGEAAGEGCATQGAPSGLEGGAASAPDAWQGPVHDHQVYPDTQRGRRPFVGAAGCDARITGEDLISNRYDGMPENTLQATIWYDGVQATRPILQLELVDPESGRTGWLAIGDQNDPVGPITRFERITTREVHLAGCRLTGRIFVEGVQADGVIDGLAFGLYTRYDDRTYRVLKSVSPVISDGANFVGGWPTGLNDQVFTERTPQLTDGHGRQAARMMLYGAQYLDNGMYRFHLP